jgi:hemerythrin superfamily protein
MRAEHVEIRAAMQQIRDALDRGDALRFREAFRTLELVLTDHDRKEERVLYPMIARQMSRDDELAMLARLAQL